MGIDPLLDPSHIRKVGDNPRFRKLGLIDENLREAAEQTTTYSGFVSNLYSEFGRQNGKQLAGEKSPGYCRHLSLLHGLFPWARTIHLIRDGRDVALSTLSWGRGPIKYDLWQEEPVGVCALYWRMNVSAGQQAGKDLGPDRRAGAYVLKADLVKVNIERRRRAEATEDCGPTHTPCRRRARPVGPSAPRAVAKLLSKHDVIAITAAISPYSDARLEARRYIGRFLEVYVKCPVEVCIKRDVKGMYQKALAGEILHFTGGEKSITGLIQPPMRHARLKCRLPEPAPDVPCPFPEVDGTVGSTWSHRSVTSSSVTSMTWCPLNHSSG